MTNLTVGSSSVAMRLVFDKLRAGEDFMVIDPKASTYQMSKTKATKRLMAAGVAIDGRKGGVLVRRGHATAQKFVMDSMHSLNFYWITESGRAAARAIAKKT